MGGPTSANVTRTHKRKDRDDGKHVEVLRKHKYNWNTNPMYRVLRSLLGYVRDEYVLLRVMPWLAIRADSEPPYLWENLPKAEENYAENMREAFRSIIQSFRKDDTPWEQLKPRVHDWPQYPIPMLGANYGQFDGLNSRHILQGYCSLDLLEFIGRCVAGPHISPDPLYAYDYLTNIDGTVMPGFPYHYAKFSHMYLIQEHAKLLMMNDPNPYVTWNLWSPAGALHDITKLKEVTKVFICPPGNAICISEQEKCIFVLPLKKVGNIHPPANLGTLALGEYVQNENTYDYIVRWVNGHRVDTNVKPYTNMSLPVARDGCPIHHAIPLAKFGTIPTASDAEFDQQYEIAEKMIDEATRSRRPPRREETAAGGKDYRTKCWMDCKRATSAVTKIMYEKGLDGRPEPPPVQALVMGPPPPGTNFPIHPPGMRPMMPPPAPATRVPTLATQLLRGYAQGAQLAQMSDDSDAIDTDTSVRDSRDASIGSSFRTPTVDPPGKRTHSQLSRPRPKAVPPDYVKRQDRKDYSGTDPGSAGPGSANVASSMNSEEVNVDAAVIATASTVATPDEGPILIPATDK